MKKTAGVLLALFLTAAFAFASLGSSQIPDTSEAESDTVQKVTEVRSLGAVINLAAYETTSATIRLQWDKVENADGYNIYILDETNGKYKLLDSVSEPYYTAKELSAGSAYSFKVRAVMVSEDKVIKGEPSSVLIAVTAPKKIKYFIASDIGGDYITLSWTSSKGATLYEVWLYSKEEEKFTLYGLTEKTSMTVNGLSDNTVYSFKIRPCISLEKAAAYGDFTALNEFTDTSAMPHTRAQAAKIYNSAVNAAKNTDDMTLTYKKSISTETISCSNTSLLRTVNNMMNLFSGEVKNKYILKDGKSDGILAKNIIEPQGEESALNGADIRSFSAKQSEKSGFVLSLKLKSEETVYDNKKTKTPLHNSKVSKTIKLQSLKVSPLVIDTAKSSFDGAEISLTLYEDSRIKKLKINNPVKVEAVCSVSTIDFVANVGYTVLETYSFKY